MTGLPMYVNTDCINAVYTDADLRCSAVDTSGTVLFVKEHSREIMNTLYQANYEQGFLFKVPEKKDGGN